MDIPKANEKPHLDIETEIQKKQNGLFTCTLKVSNGVIVDLTIVEYVDAGKYIGLEQAIIEEFTTAYRNQQRSTRDTVRPDNSQHTTKKRTRKSVNAPHRQEPAIQVSR